MIQRKPLLLVATGPTAGQFAFGPFRGVADVLAVSDAWRLCDFVDYIYACDYDWWKYHGPSLVSHPAKKYSLDVDVEPRHPMCTYLTNLGRRGFSFCEGHVFSGHNSGYQALQLAAIMGYTTIYLVGFDMGATGHTHFFGDHPPPIRHYSDYGSFISDFAHAVPVIESRLTVELLTQPSGLSHLFKYRSPANALARCKEIGRLG